MAARAIFAFAALALTAPPAARAQPLETMIDLGDLGGTASVAYGVSGDGLLVVGWARSEDGHNRAFRWTRTGGMEDLGDLGGDSSTAWGVSADGSASSERRTTGQP